MTTLKKEIYSNIRGYNKHLTTEHLNSLNWEELLRNTHPRDRESYARRLYKEGRISEDEMKLFTEKS